MTSFQDILNKPMADIKPPRPLPPGTYLCVVDGVPEIKQLGKEQNWCALYKLKPLQAQPDVDQQGLIEALDGKGLSETSINNNMWITDKAAFRLKSFLSHLGFPEESGTPGEHINASAGRQVLVTLGLRPSEDGKMMYNEIKNTAAV